MEKTIDCTGMTCPLPVVNAKKESEAYYEDGPLHILVDNETAVQNLTKFARSRGYDVSDETLAENRFRVTMQVTSAPDAALRANASPATSSSAQSKRPEKIAVVVSSDRMGTGDDALGRTLMKAFIFALTSQDTVPDHILFYNSGAYLTCEGSDSLEDLKALSQAGAHIVTCGTCLNFYGIEDRLAVGTVSNMYEIVETQLQCTTIIRP